MNITVLGRGSVGGGLARRWERAGHPVRPLGSDRGTRRTRTWSSRVSINSLSSRSPMRLMRKKPSPRREQEIEVVMECRHDDGRTPGG